MPIQDIKPALARISNNQAKYKEFYDYYAGRHALNFASDKFKNKFGKRLQKLRENLCKVVVRAPASRLEIINFLADKKNTENPAWKLWKQSKMPLVAGDVHREAFKTGDAYVIVWVDKKRKVKIYPQLANNITVWKDAETGEITKAAKAWKGDDGFYHLTLYYPDVIEKYVTKGKHETLPLNPAAFDARHIDGEDFPLPNTFGRVPVFHFKYDAEMCEQGNSLLTDVIPLNDALNKSWADILGAQEENMRRRRYVAGMQVETDEETGKKINPFKPDDDILFASDSETKFGEFSDANLTEMLDVLERAIMSICLVSGIPPSYFNLESTGNAISGDALTKLEARFIAIIQDAQRSFGETWGEVIDFGMELQNASSEELEIETQWTDAAPVDDGEWLDNAIKKKSIGWSDEQLQRDYGLSDEQIEKMKEEIAMREKAKVEAAAKFFDSGNSITEE